MDTRAGRRPRRAGWLVSLDLGRGAEVVGRAFRARQSAPHRLPLRVSTIIMTAAVLCIGTELTRGELLNSNATWLAESLTRIGLEVTAVDCVDDDRGRIELYLRRLATEHRVLVCTGGLGPTPDDITTECAARVAGVELVRDEASFDHIKERLRRFGR